MIAAGLVAPQGIRAQSLFEQVNFKSASIGGVHLNGVSVYSGYSTSPYPASAGFGSIPQPGYAALGADVNYGVSTSVGWQYRRQRTIFSIMYSGSYGGMVRYSELNGLSQSLALTMARQLSAKWLATLSATGQDTTQIQFLNQPSALTVITHLPTSFDDLAAAFAIGQFSSAQVASMLTGAPLFDSPARNLLAGNRILSYSGQVGLSYAHSSRLSLSFSGFTAAGQFRNDGKSGGLPQGDAMPRSMGLNGGVGLSYSLSPRTQFGLNANESYTISQIQGAYVSSVSSSIGRKMGQHWFLSAQGGIAITQITKQVYGTPTIRQPIGGGSIGFRTYQHTFAASYSRSGSDTYGFAAGTNTIAGVSWNWRRPGSRWSVFANAGQQEMKGNGFADLSGWVTSGGVTGRLNSQTTVTAQYSYATNYGTYLGLGDNRSIHSIRLSLAWSPQPEAQPAR